MYVPVIEHSESTYLICGVHLCLQDDFFVSVLPVKLLIRVVSLGSLAWMRYGGLLPFPSPWLPHPPTHLPSINNSTHKLTRLLPKLTQTTQTVIRQEHRKSVKLP